MSSSSLPENLESLETAEHFPYAAYRPGQREALKATRDAFAKGKRFVIVEAQRVRANLVLP
jgi:hypothetical protein